MIERAHPALTLLCAGLLAGCSAPADRIMARDPAFLDHDKRHPIELREEAVRLYIHASPGLDTRTRAQIEEFAANYHRFGAGPVLVMLPAGTSSDHETKRRLDEIRRAMSDAGLRAPVRSGTYPVFQAGAASPVRLSFMGLRAQVASSCGQWPEDLASGASSSGFSNRAYWNHGCAHQAMMAAQAADPRDFVQARAAMPQDSEMRLRAIGNVRRGVDPGTAWRMETSAASSGGAK